MASRNPPDGPAGFESWHEEWRRLTEGESEAIGREDWDGLLRIQAAKQTLQSRIRQEETSALSRGEPRGVPDPSERSRLADLLVLEERNHRLLEQRIEAARSERATLEQSRWNLHRMQRLFGASRPAGWQDYS